MNTSPRATTVTRWPSGEGEIFADGDRNDGGLFGGEIKFPNLAGLLEDDGTLAERGEFYVVIGERGELLGLLCGEIVAEEIRARGALRDKVDAAVGRPHREEILRGIVGDVFEGAGLQIEYPDVVGHAALILFPRAEFAEDTVVGDLGVVGRIRDEAAARHGQLRGHVAIEADGVELADEGVERVPAGAEDDLGGGVAPAEDDVVGAHAIGEVVAVERGGRGKALRRAAGGGHDVDFGIAVVLGGEGELRAVGRKAREDRVAGAVGETAGGAAFAGDGVELAGVGEHDGLAIGGGEAEQTRGLVGGAEG